VLCVALLVGDGGWRVEARKRATDPKKKNSMDTDCVERRADVDGRQTKKLRKN
jgi:hypothetical protein